MHKQTQRKDITEIKQFIEDHYCEQFTLEQLAALSGLSATYLSSIFKQAYHVTPTEYVTQLRIQKAKQLIYEQHLRVKDVAIEVGYHDEFYFSRVFKKLEGISPSQYAAKRQMKVAALTSSLLGYMHAADIVPTAAPINAKWTPYYFNAWLDKDIQALPYLNPETEGLQIEHLLAIQFDLVVAPRKLSLELTQSIEAHFPVYWLDDSKNCFKELAALAQHLGQEAVVKLWLDNYNKRLSEVSTQLGWNGEKPRVLVIRIYQQQLFAYSNIGIAHLLYNQLGAVSSYTQYVVQQSDETIEQAMNHMMPQYNDVIEQEHMMPQYNDVITQEQLLQMDIDHLFVIICPEDQSRATWHQLQRTIREKKEKLHQHMYVIHSDPWFEYSPVAQLRMLEELAIIVSP